MIQQRRLFCPPFCPTPRCKFHVDPTGWRWTRWGSFSRQRAPRRVPRYRCSQCRRTFSSQTFRSSYWLKRPDLLPVLYEGLNNGSALRQLARSHRVSPSTLMGQAARLGRHCLLFHHAQCPPQPPGEPVVIDGFESFEFSQYYPLHVNVAVGAESHFLYAFTDAELRRKGRMTAAQKRRRSVLERTYGRPDPKAVETSIAELLRLLAPETSSLTIRSDEHRAYPRAFRRVPGVCVAHECTPSRQARTTGNPLFPVNRLDLLVRHCGANHRRETIAYSKRRQALLERFAVFAVWFNYQKSRSEKRRDATPAEVLGLWSGRLETGELLARRLFPSQISLPPSSQRYYDGEVQTRQIPSGRRHALQLAR